jgi:hypothetical protein
MNKDFFTRLESIIESAVEGPTVQTVRQHYVPKFYLKRFALGKKLKCYRRPDQTQIFQTVNNAAIQSGMYTVGLKSGQDSDVVEVFLSQIEGEASGIIERMTKGAFPLSPEDREILALYIALQMLRTPIQKRQQDMMADNFMKQLFRGPWSEDGIREVLAHSSDSVPSPEDVDDMKQFLDSGEFEGWEASVSTNEFATTILNLAADEVSPRLQAKSWVLGIAHGKKFVTSDNPFVMWTDPARRAPLRGIGVETAEEIYFPLDRKHTLLFVDQSFGPDRVTEFQPKNVEFVNGLVCGNSYKWIFQHPDDEDISYIVPAEDNSIMIFTGGAPPRKSPMGD